MRRKLFEKVLRGLKILIGKKNVKVNCVHLRGIVSEKKSQIPAEYFRAENFVGRIGFIDALEHKFCAKCNRIRLTAEGFLKPCLNFATGLDVKKFLRSGVEDEEILRAIEAICISENRGANVKYGSFGENIVADEFTFKTLPIGTRLKSGDTCEEILTAADYKVFSHSIVPDVTQMIVDRLTELSDFGVGLIVTTGGTGFSPRDVTLEATLKVCTKLAPGIAEAMRNFSMQVTKRAMLSRAVSGIRKRLLIVNLPGSVKEAVDECLNFVLPELKHGIEILRGDDLICGN